MCAAVAFSGTRQPRYSGYWVEAEDKPASSHLSCTQRERGSPEASGKEGYSHGWKQLFLVSVPVERSILSC